MAQGKEYTKEQKDSIVRSVLEYTDLGYSLTKACKECEIPLTTVHTWVKNDEALRIKWNASKNKVNHMARKNIINDIAAGSVDQSKWWVERKEKDEFSLRLENTGAEGTPMMAELSEEDAKILKEAKEKLSNDEE